jgi:hypothetical protein
VAEGGLLTGTRCRRLEKPGRSIAPQVRDDDPVPGYCQRRRYAIICVDVVGKSVHQNNGATVRRGALLMSDVEDRGAGSPHECYPFWMLIAQIARACE